MTPFGLKMRELRARKNVTQKEMADSLGLSAAYLSALERGHKGAPNFAFVQRAITYFNIIWDEADEVMQLAGISHPRVVIDTANLSAAATRFANCLAEEIRYLDEDALMELSNCFDRLRRQGVSAKI